MRWLFIGVLFFSGRALRAAEDRVVYTPKEKLIVGSRRYFSSDTSIDVDFPGGFNVNAAFAVYRSDVSSRTATFTLGAGKDWSRGSIFGSFSRTPKADGYQATSLVLGGSIHTPSRDFRTTLGLDLAVTQHTETVPAGRGTRDVEITQNTPTLMVQQRVYGTKILVEYGHSTYNVNIQGIPTRVAPRGLRLAGLGGLLQGFPERTIKFKLSESWEPFTVWTSYAQSRLFLANQSGRAVADSYLVGVDWDLSESITGGLQYNHFVETNLPKADYFGVSLSVEI